MMLERLRTALGVLLPLRKVIMIESMAAAHEMGKPTWTNTCVHWTHCFTTTLESKVKGYNEKHLVFDRYNLKISLKEATRQRSQGDRPATTDHVEGNTPIEKVSVKQFLSQILTVILPQKKAHCKYDGSSKVFFVTSR